MESRPEHKIRQFIFILAFKSDAVFFLFSINFDTNMYIPEDDNSILTNRSFAI